MENSFRYRVSRIVTNEQMKKKKKKKETNTPNQFNGEIR